MKLNYFPDTDSLYIDPSHRPGVESQEVSEGVVLDYDGEGNLVGIDIDHASRKLELRELVTNHIPLEAKCEFSQQSTLNHQLLLTKWSDWGERHGRQSREVAVERCG